ncbi:nuclear transport factor 2 family protein [Confluentibacter lentus]|uniref:nuclear transport factor 2 family protein n=1 Tax=Confluentibacter lentus TaxID=1699412 RepID=UPI000C284587|nr:nuclear transport factor 2 family protein [Confluentibacter lentus]
MKRISTLIILFLSITFGFSQEKNSKLTPLEIVNKRMASYNSHDFQEFIKLYADDVEIYTYPNQLLATGTDNLASIFEPKFAAKSIKVEIVSQMNNGNYVINHEIVTEEGKDTKYVSIYEVINGLIKTVKFVRDK